MALGDPSPGIGPVFGGHFQGRDVPGCGHAASRALSHKGFERVVLDSVVNAKGGEHRAPVRGEAGGFCYAAGGACIVPNAILVGVNRYAQILAVGQGDPGSLGVTLVIDIMIVDYARGRENKVGKIYLVLRRSLWISLRGNDVANGSADEVDHRDEISRISVTPGSGSRRLEEAVEAFQPCVRVP
jgi:hypothetical protein